MPITLDGTNGISTPNTLTVDSQNISATNSLGFRNRIINGDMRIDQRNAGASTTGATSSPYTLDRWKVFSATANCGVQQVSGFNGFQNALRVTGVASNTGISVFQRIESFNTFDLASQTITVSFLTNSSVASRSVDIVFQNPTTTANDFGALTEFARQTITVPNGVGTHTVTVTAGAGVVRGIQLVVELGALTSGTIDITGVQLEAGSVATPFERIDYGRQLIQCQRYFQVIKPPLAISAAGTVDTTLVGILTYSVRMRATPTVSQSGVFRYEIPFGDAKTQSSANVSFDAPSTNDVGAAIILGNFSSLVFNRTYRQDLNTNALLFSAEL